MPVQAWPLSSLRQYIQWAKTTFHPLLTEDAQDLLATYFQLKRQLLGQQGSRTTVRTLEGLVRVAQAHARLMARSEVRTSCVGVHGIIPQAEAAAHLRCAALAGRAVLPLQVTLQDAVVAVWLAESSSADSQLPALAGFMPDSSAFPEDPDMDYVALQQAMLRALQGDRYLLEC